MWNWYISWILEEVLVVWGFDWGGFAIGGGFWAGGWVLPWLWFVFVDRGGNKGAFDLFWLLLANRFIIWLAFLKVSLYYITFNYNSHQGGHRCRIFSPALLQLSLLCFYGWASFDNQLTHRMYNFLFVSPLPIFSLLLISFLSYQIRKQQLFIISKWVVGHCGQPHCGSPCFFFHYFLF